MQYIAVLRVLNVLKWLAIVLGAFCLLHGLILAMVPALVRSDAVSDTVPLPFFFSLAGFFSALVASRLALGLSEENESHLALALTKPVSRTRYALSLMAVDVVGILAAFVMLFVAEIIVTAQHQALAQIVVTPDSGTQLIRFLALPLAFYGVLTAVTARFGHGARAMVGWSWGAAIFLLLLSAVELDPWRSIVAALNIINPLFYATYSYQSANGTVNVVSSGAAAMVAPALDCVALAALGCAGIAVAISQWHRVEA